MALSARQQPPSSCSHVSKSGFKAASIKAASPRLAWVPSEHCSRHSASDSADGWMADCSRLPQQKRSAGPPVFKRDGDSCTCAVNVFHFLHVGAQAA